MFCVFLGGAAKDVVEDIALAGPKVIIYYSVRITALPFTMRKKEMPSWLERVVRITVGTTICLVVIIAGLITFALYLQYYYVAPIGKF